MSSALVRAGPPDVEGEVAEIESPWSSVERQLDDKFPDCPREREAVAGEARGANHL
jgi:hypothetical protein